MFISNIMIQGLTNNARYYVLLVGLGTFTLIIAQIMRKARIRELQMRLEVIDFLLAYREFEEETLRTVAKGSPEWLEAIKPFKEVCREHGTGWEQLLQTEIDDV